jgi:phage shock protein A
MGIFRRFTDILSANLNDLIDRFEDPEKALRQAIREMEQAVTDALNSAAKVIANERLLTRRLTEHRAQADQWLVRARHAIQVGDETLARRALARRNEHDRLVAALSDQQVSLEQTSGKLRRQVDAMRVRVAEAQRKLTTIVARKQAADAQRVLVDAGPSAVATAALSKFDRLCERVEATEVEADAWSELAGISAENDLWQSDAEAEIERQLRTLRAEVETTAT